MPKFCGTCGTKVLPKNRFCAECGARLQEEKNAKNSLSDFKEYLGMNYFVVETIDLNFSKKYAGPITINGESFFYPPKPEHVRFCEHCEVQLSDLGWNYGPDKDKKDRYLCSECILVIVNNRNTWIVPLLEREYFEDFSSILGCVVFTNHSSTYRERHCYVDKVRSASKTDKKFNCIICGCSLGQNLKKNKYDYIYSVSEETSSGSWTYNVCLDCMMERLVGGDVLTKLKKPSDIFRLRKKA
jgi:hypothetical protein